MCADARMTYYVARFTILFCVHDYYSVEQHSNKTVLTCMKQVKPVGVSNQP